MPNKITRLDLAKQELMQADAKVGWVTAIFILIIGVMISIGFQEEGAWIIIGCLISLPSLIFLLAALYPKVSIKKSKIKETDYFNSISIGQHGINSVDKITENHIGESADKSSEIYSKLANNKYKLIKISILISFFWIWPIIWLLRKIK